MEYFLDPAREEKDSAGFWFMACEYLLDYLGQDDRLRTTPFYDKLFELVGFCREQIINSGNTRKNAENAALDLFYFGTVAKAVWYVTEKEDPQFRRELLRFAKDPDGAIGNHYLFYIAGTLGAHSYRIGFVPEAGKTGEKTPDLWAEKNGRKTWIEANAKQPTRAIDTPEKVRQLIRDAIGEKKLKFTNPSFAPGLIVVDVSPIADQINAPGTFGQAPLISLRPETCYPLPADGGFLCRLYEDAAWATRPENQGNVFAFLVEEFSAVDRTRFHVAQCLVTISRRVVASPSGLSFPRQHQLIVDKNSENIALTELSKSVYVV